MRVEMTSWPRAVVWLTLRLLLWLLLQLTVRLLVRLTCRLAVTAGSPHRSAEFAASSFSGISIRGDLL